MPVKCSFLDSLIPLAWHPIRQRGAWGRLESWPGAHPLPDPMAVMQKGEEAQGISHSRSLGPGALLELLEPQRAQSQALALANDPPAAPAGPSRAL